MVNKKTYANYLKEMERKGTSALNYKQYKYIHKGTATSRANIPQYIRTKKLKKLM